jgi:hypothetical protein
MSHQLITKLIPIPSFPCASYVASFTFWLYFCSLRCNIDCRQRPRGSAQHYMTSVCEIRAGYTRGTSWRVFEWTAARPADKI